jgi:GNAT superfamily N-acetyltransferase
VEAIRRARPAEAAALSALALRSKAYWGYDAAFLRACVEPLTVSPERIARWPYFVLEAEDRLLGFAGLGEDAGAADLAFLFVEPSAIRQGVGRRLWAAAVEAARELGYRELRIASDQHAEPFYLAMGAVRIGETPSEAVPGRMNPLLSYYLDGVEHIPASPTPA